MNINTPEFYSLIQNKIQELSGLKTPLFVAIDGRCASGKTTLASFLKETLACNVIPMDHFFLQPHMRTEERLQQPGGNVDYERFLNEVMLPLTAGQIFSYQPYNCHLKQFDAPIEVKPAHVTIIEGSYSCHPSLQEKYDYKIFLTTSYEEQLRRIANRNGKDSVTIFKEKWIPLEENYFHELNIKEHCDTCITT